MSQWINSTFSQRQPDMYDSPSSSEYSNGSTNASEQMEQTQPEVYTLHHNVEGGLQAIQANDENTHCTLDNKILAREATNQGCVEGEMDEGVSALLITEFSYPLQITPLFRSFADAVPSPQFSESERHFLLKTLGIESSARSKSANPSYLPPCIKTLVHSL